ncbi:hypothetical protein HanIR_Chr09g0406061 [Helianthus annuus]|nr:hypothetical protein HanIR_Chr09g0406061 [Helianthus annuus]
MPSTSSSGKPFGAFRRSVLGFGADHVDKQVHSENGSKSPLELELHAFQDQIFSQFNALSSASDDQFLSIDWMSNLLDAFLACQEHFTAILLNNAGTLSKPPLDKLLTEFFDRSIKALDICNAVRDGIEKVRLWHKHLEIVSTAFDSKQRNLITEGQFRRARKALNDLAIVMLDDHKDSGSVSSHRNRSFGRPNKGKDVNHQRKKGHSKSLSWSVSISWSAMAAIPCQDRGVFGFSLPKQFSWSNPLSLIHTRVLDESKKRERKNSPGLLREIYKMEKSINVISDLIDSAHQFPLTEEQQKEVKEGVEELSLVCTSCKSGLDTFDRQLREVFCKVMNCRIEGLGAMNRTES